MSYKTSEAPNEGPETVIEFDGTTVIVRDARGVRLSGLQECVITLMATATLNYASAVLFAPEGADNYDDVEATADGTALTISIADLTPDIRDDRVAHLHRSMSNQPQIFGPVRMHLTSTSPLRRIEIR